VVAALAWLVLAYGGSGDAFAQPADAGNGSPALELPPVPKPPPGALSGGAVKIRVQSFRFEGNHVFSSAHLASLPDVKKYTATTQPIGIEELEQVRQAVTLEYVNHKYVNSGAVLPDQTIDDPDHAVVKIQVVEGRLTEIDLKQEGFAPGHRFGGKPMLTRDYVLGRIKLGEGPPLKLDRLADQLEVLRQDPNVSRVNAELRPGLKPGEAALDVTVAETNPFQLALEFNNKRSPDVGGERIYALASDTNVSGHGDAFAIRYGITKGGLEHMQLAGWDDVIIDYSLPLNRYDTSLILNYTRDDDLVLSAPFSTVNITSESESGSIGLRQPLYRTPNSQFAVSVFLARRYNITKLLGEPFDFSPGYNNGRSDVTALRFGQEWVTRTENQTIALRSTISWGIDALGSTITKSGDNDSRFLAWLGQAQYVRRIGQDSELLFRFDTQLADNPLPAIEQFSMGGYDTVRGYRENRLVRDDGIIGSVEWRIPIWRKSNRPILDVAPFLDGGYSWNFHNSKTAPPEFIGSGGVGLLFNPNRHLALSVYYGYPFKHFKDSNDIQDKGLHFDVILSAFE
jgi:hemolysin activation/secretion protein